MTTDSQTVLHVEADGGAAVVRANMLRRHGYLVQRARDQTSALEVAEHTSCDLALVHRDVSGDDHEFGEALRRIQPSLGIVMLAPSWERGEWRSTLSAFADDCLDDTIEGESLIARVRSLCRRSLGGARPGSVRCGPLLVDFVGAFVEIGGREIALQPLQLRILGYLMRRVGEVVTREELRRHVFRTVQTADSTSVARQVCILRKQLGPWKGLVMTVRGGYCLCRSSSMGVANQRRSSDIARQ